MRPPHVIPADDLIDHLEAVDDCPCGPTLQLARQDDGTVSWANVHHSLDGRERNK